VDGPQTYRRNTMPVEMIELEEVMMETSDDALEFSCCVQAAATIPISTLAWPC
jgi:hypothetical protein